MDNTRERWRARSAKEIQHWIGVKHGWEAEGSDPLGGLVSLGSWQLATHALLIGATGSGKTNLLHHLIARDVLAGHSFAVLDLRGDLVAAVLEILAGRADPRKAVVLDLREKRHPTGFDPLFGAGEPFFRALAVTDAVGSQWDLGVQTSETLRNALMLLSEAGQPLTRLEALFNDRAFLRDCLGACGAESVAAFWLRFDEMAPDRKAGLAMPVMNKVSSLFATDSLRRTLGHPAPIDLGRHLDTPGGAFLVSLAADELHAAGRAMGRLVLASLCREVFGRVRVAESRRNPVRLYVDEFEHFGTQEFETILAEGRRFGLSLVLAHQTLAQLAPRMRSLILGNVGVKITFRCGHDDAVTLSKDLTGDAKALDLAALRPGECVLWTRGDGHVRVEVNQPIVTDVGRLSPAARRFLSAARESAGRHAARPPSRPVHPSPEASANVPVRGSRGGATLEDWLS